MKGQTLLRDLAIGLAAGFAATKVTEVAQIALYKPMPDGVKEQEENVRPGPPPEIAARKAAEATGIELDDRQLAAATTAVHDGLGLAWGVVYVLLRRYSGMKPAGAGFATGAGMSLIVDEALTPALGFSAPDRDYPAATHLRGFAGHLVFGAAAALTAEALYALTGRNRQANRQMQGERFRSGNAQR